MDKVEESFVKHDIQAISSGLLHFDLHFGNVIVATGCEENDIDESKCHDIDANSSPRKQNLFKDLHIIDWEFAGIADPRVEFARYCNRMGSRSAPKRDKVCEILWPKYCELMHLESSRKSSLGPNGDSNLTGTRRLPESSTTRSSDSSSSILRTYVPFIGFEYLQTLVLGCVALQRCCNGQSRIYFDAIEWAEDVVDAETLLREWYEFYHAND